MADVGFVVVRLVLLAAAAIAIAAALVGAIDRQSKLVHFLLFHSN